MTALDTQKPRVMLPNDVARCSGVGSDEEGWREGCEDCARRLAASTSDVYAWMLPPPIIVFWCESRIETEKPCHESGSDRSPR